MQHESVGSLAGHSAIGAIFSFWHVHSLTIFIKPLLHLSSVTVSKTLIHILLCTSKHCVVSHSLYQPLVICSGQSPHCWHCWVLPKTPTSCEVAFPPHLQRHSISKDEYLRVPLSAMFNYFVRKDNFTLTFND